MKKVGLALAAAVTMLAATVASDAEACGGCFAPPEENTVVTGHNMVLTIGKTQSTLYDQIEYDGDPAEFAWVLPISGTVELGLSSDLIFTLLKDDTAVRVIPPPTNCPLGCDNFGGSAIASSSSGTGPGGGGVVVLAEQQVGPYDTVQLQSSDPLALQAWLTQNGFSLPDDIKPIIDEYVADNFNFLAMKLAPGQGIDRMQPVRITSAGAGAMLPLKMVAAGTGATTLMTLFVVGEGRYEPANFPSFTIPESELVWDWNTSSSNYKDLRQAGFDQLQGFGWLVEAARPYSAMSLAERVFDSAQFDPVGSGYTSDPNDSMGALEAAQLDMATMFGELDLYDVWVTRIRGEMSRKALANDLFVEAAADQGEVESVFFPEKTNGNPCPPVPDDCGESTGASMIDDDGGNGSGSGFSSGGCSTSGDMGSAALGSTVLMLMFLFGRRRRERDQA